MAYRAPYLTEEDQNNPQAAGRQTSGVTDAYTSAGGGSGTPAAPAAAPTPGTGFVNLQQYLDTNKGKGAEVVDTATKPLQDQAAAFKDTTAQTVKAATADYTKAAGGDVANSLTEGLKADASGTQRQAADFLGAGYAGKGAGDYIAGLGAQAGDLAKSLSSVDDAETLKTSIKDAYGKTGGYTSGFGNLDGFLIGNDAAARDKLNAVKGEAKSVDATLNGAKWTLNNANTAAQKALEEHKAKLRQTAAATRDAKLAPALQSRDAKNAALDASRLGAHKAGLGDEITDAKTRADIDALNALVKGDPLDWSGGYNEGEAPVTIQTGTVSPASKGSNSLPGANALGGILKTIDMGAAAYKDIMDGWAKHGEAWQKAAANPNAGTIGNVVATGAKAPIQSAAAGVDTAVAGTNKVNDMSGAAVDRWLPGLGKIVDPINIPGRQPVPKLKTPKW